MINKANNLTESDNSEYLKASFLIIFICQQYHFLVLKTKESIIYDVYFTGLKNL